MMHLNSSEYASFCTSLKMMHSAASRASLDTPLADVPANTVTNVCWMGETMSNVTQVGHCFDEGFPVVEILQLL